MKPIVYLIGDATKPQAAGNKIIAHVCNDTGAWGKGFVLALSKMSPAPERSFREWYAGRENNDFALGAVQFVSVSPNISVANMIGQRGIRTLRNVPPIRYDAIETALKTVGNKARIENSSVHLPRIGCGLAGGDWNKIESLIKQQIGASGVPVFVYDLK
ncbi:MAG: Appr-1-p processing protein [Acidobacteriota bacterium]